MQHEPPAHVAPAVSSPTTDSSTVTGSRAAIRVGGTLGLGGGGVAATFLGTVDIWLGRSLGLGLEGMRGSGKELNVLGSSDNSHLSAVRLRVSTRWLKLKNTELGATLALGAAAWDTRDEYPDTAPCVDDPYSSSPGEPSLPECSDSIFSYASTNRSGIDVSFAAEFGARTRVRLFEIGAVVRIDVAPDIVLMTVGPTLGVAF